MSKYNFTEADFANDGPIVGERYHKKSKSKFKRRNKDKGLSAKRGNRRPW